MFFHSAAFSFSSSSIFSSLYFASALTLLCSLFAVLSPAAVAEPLGSISSVMPVLTHALPEEAPIAPAEPAAEEEPRIDLSLSSLSLTNLTGARVDAQDLENKKVVIYFWSIYCRGCVGAFEELETLRSDLAKENAELLTVHLFEPNTEKLMQAARRIGVTLPILLAPKKIRDLFAIRLLPTSLVFDSKHQLVARFEGKYNDKDVRLSILNKVTAPLDTDTAIGQAPVNVVASPASP